MKTFHLGSVLAAVVVLATACSSAAVRSKSLASPTSIVRDFITRVSQGDFSTFNDVVASDVIQHDPRIGDNATGWLSYLNATRIAQPLSTRRIARIFAQDDLVLVHSHYVPNPASNGSSDGDIFRVSQNKIVEHWGTTTVVANATIPGDRNMFSVLSDPKIYNPDHSQPTNVTIDVSTKFVNLVYGPAATVEQLEQYGKLPYYTHSPTVGDGWGPIVNGSHNIATIKMTIAEGDLLGFLFDFEAVKRMAVSLFRVRDGFVVEHWYSLQGYATIVSANSNSLF